MNPLLKLSFASFLIFSTSYLFAQKTNEPEIAGKWHITNVIYLNESEGLGIIEYSEKKQGVVKVNKMAKAEWEVPVEGRIIGLGKYKDNAIIFYIETKDWDDWNEAYKRIDNIHSAIVDLKSHQLVNDKIAYTGDDYIIPDVQNDPAGNFKYLLIRKTSKNYPEKTKGLTILSLKENENIESKEIPTVAINGNYINCLTTNGGNIFVGCTNERSVVVEKFNSSGILENKLETPLDLLMTYPYDSKMCLDSLANNTVSIDIQYTKNKKGKTLSFCHFNFDEKKAVTAAEVKLGKASPYKFQGREFIKPVDILYTKDKIIIVKEVQDIYSVGNSSKQRYTGETMVVSIYDKQLHLTHDLVIPKRNESFFKTGIGLGCFIKNEKLFILSVELKSIGVLDNYCFVIDLNSGKVERKKIGYNKPSSTRTVATHSTFWFPNECVVSHLFAMKTFGRKFETILEKITYDDIEKLTTINK